MSMAPATASSSSSQSSSDSWQPSQEANFQTASLGLRGGGIVRHPHPNPPPLSGGGLGWGCAESSSNLLQREQSPHLVVAHHRAILADETAGELTMPAQSHGAFHVALQREMDGILGQTDVVQRAGGKPHHDFGPTNQRQGIWGVDTEAGYQLGHHPNMATPVDPGVIDRHLDFHIELLSPIRQL